LPLAPGGFIHRSEVIQAPEPGGGFGLEEAQHFFDPLWRHLKGRHVRGLGRGGQRVPEFFLERQSEGFVRLGQL
jgi:hypothetical protein